MTEANPGLQRVEVAGLSLAYRQAGAGRPLVLLHGAYQDSRAWHPQLAGLSDEFRVVALDVPGYGASDDPPETWTAADFGDCLAGFVAALGLNRPTVLGLSFGSVLALTLYGQHPDSVGALVLASAYAGWAGSLPPEEVRRRMERGRHELEMDPDEFRSHFMSTWIPTLVTSAAPRELVEEITTIATGFHPAGMRAALRTMGDVDLRPVLPTIMVPTLLLYGDADVRSPIAVAEDLQARIPGSRLVTLPGAPHVSSAEQPAAFNRAVREFLHRLKS